MVLQMLRQGRAVMYPPGLCLLLTVAIALARFQEYEFGFCSVHRQEIVSWCTPNCVSAPRCEMGIHTDRKYR